MTIIRFSRTNLAAIKFGRVLVLLHLLWSRLPRLPEMAGLLRLESLLDSSFISHRAERRPTTTHLNSALTLFPYLLQFRIVMQNMQRDTEITFTKEVVPGEAKRTRSSYVKPAVWGMPPDDDDDSTTQHTIGTIKEIAGTWRKRWNCYVCASQSRW